MILVPADSYESLFLLILETYRYPSLDVTMSVNNVRVTKNKFIIWMSLKIGRFFKISVKILLGKCYFDSFFFYYNINRKLQAVARPSSNILE